MKNDSGTTISKPIDSVLKLIFVLVITCLSWQVQAACTFFDGFKDNNDGTVTDPRNGLIWKRCAEGFEWNGTACQGSKKEVDWFGAMQAAKQSRFLGQGDWRIPSKVEFETVLSNNEDCKKNDTGKYAASRVIAHAVNGNWAESFWSVSSNNGAFAWHLSFDTGEAYNHGRGKNDVGVRLVRTSQSFSGGAALEFKTEYTKIGQYKKDFAAQQAELGKKFKEKQADSARLAREQAREDERRAKADRERIATACDRFYPGKAIGYKPPGFVYFGNALDAVVLGKGGGNISVKIVDTDYRDAYGKILEVSCNSDRLQ